ncbi:Uncharacterised protein [uncultured archaeon]|nr:Uncharacterised protein [uncultured archaeon]
MSKIGRALRVSLNILWLAILLSIPTIFVIAIKDPTSPQNTLLYSLAQVLVALFTLGLITISLTMSFPEKVKIKSKKIYFIIYIVFILLSYAIYPEILWAGIALSLQYLNVTSTGSIGIHFIAITIGAVLFLFYRILTFTYNLSFLKKLHIDKSKSDLIFFQLPDPTKVINRVKILLFDFIMATVFLTIIVQSITQLNVAQLYPDIFGVVLSNYFLFVFPLVVLADLYFWLVFVKYKKEIFNKRSWLTGRKGKSGYKSRTAN